MKNVTSANQNTIWQEILVGERFGESFIIRQLNNYYKSIHSPNFSLPNTCKSKFDKLFPFPAIRYKDPTLVNFSNCKNFVRDVIFVLSVVNMSSVLNISLTRVTVCIN